MTTLRVHFDGKVLVPEGPVELPQGRSFEVEVRPLSIQPATSVRRPLTFHMKNGIPVVDVPKGTPPLTAEMVRRLLEDDEE